MLIKCIEWRTILKWATVLIVIGFSIHMGHLTKSWLSAQEMRVGGPIPYTVVLSETVFRADGSSKRGIIMTQAIRSDGSFVVLSAYEKSDGEPLGMEKRERTIRFASGIKVAINELTGTKSTETYKFNPARWQRDPNSKCFNAFDGTAKVSSPPAVISGEETIAGYRTVKIIRENATWWFALDVGCAMVKERMDWGGQGSSEKNLVTITHGEPEAALFDVSANIREAPPSERMLRPGLTLKPRDIELLRSYDDAYYKNRVVK